MDRWIRAGEILALVLWLLAAAMLGGAALAHEPQPGVTYCFNIYPHSRDRVVPSTDASADPYKCGVQDRSSGGNDHVHSTQHRHRYAWAVDNGYGWPYGQPGDGEYALPDADKQAAWDAKRRAYHPEEYRSPPPPVLDPPDNDGGPPDDPPPPSPDFDGDFDVDEDDLAAVLAHYRSLGETPPAELIAAIESAIAARNNPVVDDPVVDDLPPTNAGQYDLNRDGVIDEKDLEFAGPDAPQELLDEIRKRITSPPPPVIDPTDPVVDPPVVDPVTDPDHDHPDLADADHGHDTAHEHPAYATRTALERQAARIAALAELIGHAEEHAHENTDSIEINTAAIGVNGERIGENRASIIGTNERVSDNTLAIWENVEALQDHETRIEANAAGVEANRLGVAENSLRLDTHEARIGTAEAGVQDNARAIGLNRESIAANTVAIGEVSERVTANTASIGGLRQELDEVRSGVAASMALSQIAQGDGIGVGIGYGQFGEHDAVAVGGSYSFRAFGQVMTVSAAVSEAGEETAAATGFNVRF